MCSRPILILFFAVAACAPSQAPRDRTFKPIEPAAAPFWDRQTTETADLLNAIAADFNKQWTGIPLKVVQSGDYRDIYLKVTASIRGGALPAMAVAYESMTAEYVRAGAVAPLDDLIRDPERGLTQAELDDYFPAVLETNRFHQYGGKLYSFPFTKSVLVMYFNKRVLNAAGFDAPPAAWDQFLEQCRAIKAKTGNFAWAFDVDASTMNGMILSMGGEMLDGEKTAFDSPASIRYFELMETLAREQLVYQLPPRTFNDEAAFREDKIAFILRSSASKPHVERQMNDPAAWGVALIPQDDPARPRTVLLGANVCIFNTTPEQKETAWAFVKYFTSPEVSVRWALGTGYVPIRKSAVNDPALQAFWAEWEYNRVPFDALPYAVPQPNIIGWQEVRDAMHKALTAVLAGLKSGRQAALDLKREADAILAAY